MYRKGAAVDVVVVVRYSLYFGRPSLDTKEGKGLRARNWLFEDGSLGSFSPPPLILDQPLCQATRIFTSLPKSIRVKRSHHHVCLKDSRSCHGPVSCFISSLHSKSRRFILACRRRRHNVGLLNFFLGTTELGRFSSFPFFLSRTYYSKFDRTGFL